MIRAKQLAKAGGPHRLARYLQRRQPKAKETHGGLHGPNVSVRTATHNGHKIEIRTTYEVTIEGKPLKGHMGVGNDGRVHYHAIPNYSAGSMLDLVASVIDAFPDDYPPTKTKPRKRERKKGHAKGKKSTSRHGKH